MENWEPKDFNRRWYHYGQDPQQRELDRARRVSFQVVVDRRTLIDMELREPGLVALISRPDDDGFQIHIVEPGGKRFHDVASVEATETSLLPWQQLLLFGDQS